MNKTQNENSQEPVALGQGPLANNMNGGHFAIVQEMEYPRWIVTHEKLNDDGTGHGVAIDLKCGAICRWFLVPHGSSLIEASMCGFKLHHAHLVIPTAQLLKGGRMDQNRKLSLLAPIVDYLTQKWENHDNQCDNGVQTEETPATSPIIIDRRALDLLAALHGGAYVKDDGSNWTVEACEKTINGVATRVDVYQGEMEEKPGSAGHQLVHNLLARRDRYGQLFPTPAGRAAASKNGYAAGPVTDLGKNISIEPGLPVSISEEDIDEPRCLRISSNENLIIACRDHYIKGRETITIAVPGVGEIVIDSSGARALVDHLSPTVFKGERVVIGLGYGARLEIGNKQNAYLKINKDNVQVTLTQTTIHLLRSIIREASKKGGSGGCIENVPVTFDCANGYYAEAEADEDTA